MVKKKKPKKIRQIRPKPSKKTKKAPKKIRRVKKIVKKAKSVKRKTKKKIIKPIKIKRAKVRFKQTKKFKPKQKPKLRPKPKPKVNLPKVRSQKSRVIKEKETNQPSLEESTVHQTRIRVIGIGGGGGSIISEISPDVKRVDFVAANTDNKSLNEMAKKVKRFQFGQALTRGLGTGMNDEVGEAAALAEKDKIKKLLEGQDLCIIVACLGGGTSSGAAHVFAKTSRNLGNLTYGIFTLPFEFEGEKKMELANKALEKIKPSLNAYSIIPNERIFQIIDKDTPLKNALSAINKRLADNLEGLIEMIYLAGLINIDFADLKTVLQGQGRLAYLNTIDIDESNREEAIKKVVSSPLYPYTIKGARGILYNITGGRDLQLSEVSYISKIISDSVNKQAKIIFGINQSPIYQDKIRITLLATGCASKDFLPQFKEKIKPTIPKVKKISKKVMRRPKKQIKNKTQAKKTIKNKKTAKTPKKSEEKKIESPKLPQQAENKPELEKIEVKIRRNGLQLKKVIEEEEKELLEQEEKWETPAILRKEDNN